MLGTRKLDLLVLLLFSISPAFLFFFFFVALLSPVYVLGGRFF